MIVRCTCCARQFVSNDESTDRTICKKFAKADVDGAICHECGKDLDENGNFPGEC